LTHDAPMGEVRGFGRTIAVPYFRVNSIPKRAEVLETRVEQGVET
jgi:hypothetical protein